jgi:hypothetical protein
VVATLFALCVAPTFISYKPYIFTWDDAEYLNESIEASRAFWSGDIHGLRSAIVSVHPPAMTLLGLPWGPLTSWHSAGKCFITLAALISLLVASCLYLLLRIGVKPHFLVIAAACVGVSLGPFLSEGSGHLVTVLFETHAAATGFLADSLFAWVALAAVLLVPYQSRHPFLKSRDAVIRGFAWGLIFSIGISTKLSFLYFDMLIVPLLLFISFRQNGLRNTITALVAFSVCMTPITLYLFRWGQPAFELARSASFGTYAHLYYNTPLIRFLGNTFQKAPGLMLTLVFMAGALVSLVFYRHPARLWPDILALFVMIGFAIIVLASPNREARFVFPVIVALPFMFAILISGRGDPVPHLSAVGAAVLVFCSLVAAALPMRDRPNSESLARSNAVLAQAARCNVKRIILATDSPTLNWNIIRLAMTISGLDHSINIGSLPYDSRGNELSPEEGFSTVLKFDQVAFQHTELLNLMPLFNQRVNEYENYIRQAGYTMNNVYDDVDVYSIRCHSVHDLLIR